MAGDDGPQQVFDVPAILLERFSQPIEQVHLFRGLALSPEIFGCFDQTDSEDLLPETVDGDSGGQRVFRVDQPAGKCQSIKCLFSVCFRRSRQKTRESCFHLVGRFVVQATSQDEGLSRFFHVGHHHDFRKTASDVVALLDQLRPLCRESFEFRYRILVAAGNKLLLLFIAFFGTGLQCDQQVLFSLFEFRLGPF